MDLPHAMSFYQPKDLLLGLRRARSYAGDYGRIMTLLEIVTLKVHSAKAQASRGADTWFTSASTLFFGYADHAKKKDPVIMVAHDTGPMWLRGMCEKVYVDWSAKLEDDYFGTIRPNDFDDLHRGRYGGDVNVIDAAPYIETGGYNAGALKAHVSLTMDDVDDPLVKALFGEHRVGLFEHYARLQPRTCGNTPAPLGYIKFPYGFKPDQRWGNFIAIDQLGLSIDLCARDDTVKFVGVRDGLMVSKIVEAPNLDSMATRMKEIQSLTDLHRHELDLMRAMQKEGVL